MPYYAVAKGRRVGIYNTWDECKKQTDKFKGPIFKKFNTYQEAKEFLKRNNPSGCSSSNEQIKTKNLIRSIHPTFPAKRNRNSFIDQSDDKQFRFKTKRTKFEDNSVNKSVNFNEIQYNQLGDPIVYTDGGCQRNGGKNARAGVGVFWANNHPDNVSCLLQGKQTNNRAEIEAAIMAIETALKNNYRTLEIRTDSMFMINSMTNWIYKWKSNGWKLAEGEPVKNKDDWIRLDNLKNRLDRLIWTKVKGHSGDYGNEQADLFATRVLN